MKRKSIAFPLIMSALLGGLTLSSCGKKGEESSTETTQAVLVKIDVSNPKTDYFLGDSLVKPTVIATFNDGTTKDVTNEAAFTPTTLNTLGSTTIIVSYQGKTKTFLVNVSTSSISSLKIGDNTKTVYAYGESFVNPTSIKAVYSNGSTSDITFDATVNSDSFNPNKSGTYEIIISYSQYTLKYNVTVNPPTSLIQSIAIDGTPKTDYQVGDTLVKPTIIGTFSGGTKDITNDCEFVYNFSESGEKTVLVKYTQDGVEKTTSYNVTVTSTNTKVKFAIFADVQLCAAESGEGKAANLGETANAPLALEQHLNYIKSQNIDVILMNGDITNQANENYYKYFESIVTKVYGSNKAEWPEFVWNMGNHEWWAGTTEKDPRSGSAGSYTLPSGNINSVKLFNDYARIESDNLVERSTIKYASNVTDTLPSYYKVINGVPFLVISAVESSGLITAELKAEINSWLSDIKQLDSVKAGGPIFVQYHYPLATSMTHGQGSHEANTTAIDEIFGSIPNAVIFTGDTHFPGANERAINQVDYTTINLGTSSYSRMVDESAVICSDFENVTGGNKGDERGEIAQGDAGFKNAYTPTLEIVDVYENNTTKIQRKMSNPDGTARKVGEDWLIPTVNSKADFTYTSDRFQKTSSAQKLYGKDGVSWEDSDKVTFGVNATEKQMTVQFKDPVEHNFVEHFDIKVNGQHHYFVSNYYKYPEDRQQNYFVIENLTLADSYTVEVTAYDFYDNPSLNKLTGTSNDETKTIDPIDLCFADGNYNYSDIETRNNLEYVSKDSHSSSEFYYKGIQTYNAGAILGRLIEKDKLKVSNYLSLESGEGTKPVVKFDVKNLKNDDLVFGLSVVTTGNSWKTDFGAEYQKTVTGTEWTTLSWDLYSLFGISSKEALENITLKAKSKAASDKGYEMNFLVDNIDIVNEGGTPIPPQPSTGRGEAITSGEDTKVTLNEQVPLTGKVSVDLKLDTANTTGKVSIALFDNANWDNYYGYYSFFSNGTMENTTTGVTISPLSDGYFRVTFNLPEMVKIHATDLPSTFIDTVYVRGAWTDINGRIDVNPPSDVTVVRGDRFTAGQDCTLEFKSAPLPIDQPITVDLKFDEANSEKKISIMLGQGWNNYFGYFDIYSTGKLSSEYAGVKAYQLDDGYTRVIFTLSEITKVTGTRPDSYIDLIYIRGIWNNADGYIDVNANTGSIVRGDRFKTGVDYTVDLTTNISLNETFIFDIKFDEVADDKYIQFMLGQGWNQYYGYFKINSNGTLGDTYNGVSIEALTDGYYRVTMNTAQLTKVNDMPAPDSYINLFYLSQKRSTASGLIELNPSI